MNWWQALAAGLASGAVAAITAVAVVAAARRGDRRIAKEQQLRRYVARLVQCLGDFSKHLGREEREEARGVTSEMHTIGMQMLIEAGDLDTDAPNLVIENCGGLMGSVMDIEVEEDRSHHTA